MATLRTLLALLVVVSALLGACLAAPEVPVSGGWRRGRSSWYGNQNGQFVAQFAAARGGGKDAFGILPWGGCGLTNGDGTIPWPKDQVTSYADKNPDYPGSCGRCYEIRCSPGPVLGWNDAPVDASQNYFQFWKYANATDDQGRSWPGMGPGPAQSVNVQCWPGNNSVVVRVIDICNCYYAPKGKQPYFQYDCCYKSQNNIKSGQHNFDMSYWAFQKLAHPEYGIMMVDFRPVDCTTHQPIQLEPGYISDNIYSDLPGTGWAFFRTGAVDQDFAVAASGAGVNGSTAACARFDRVQDGSGISFACRECGMQEGYQPFAGAKGVSFWVRDWDAPGRVPAVRMVLGTSQVLGGAWCNNKISLGGQSPAARTADGWRKYQIATSAFDCPKLEQANQLTFEVTGPTKYCVDEVQIQK